jgi:hypothetical protein
VKKTIVRTRSPEEQELERKLAELESLKLKLVQRELELTTLQAELQSFELHYLRIVGIRIAKLDDIKAQIAEVFAKIHATDEIAVNEAKQARAQASESAQATGAAQVHPKVREDFTSSENIKSLFREAAKRIHPDFAIDENDRNRRTKLMAEINDAYKSGDEGRLRKILKEWKDSPENIVGDDIGAKLIRAIRKIAQVQGRLSSLESEISLLMLSDLYKLRVKVGEADTTTTKLLEEMAVQLDEQIIEQQERLDKLMDIYINAQSRNQKHG